jgi:hypothetical protein
MAVPAAVHAVVPWAALVTEQFSVLRQPHWGVVSQFPRPAPAGGTHATQAPYSMSPANCGVLKGWHSIPLGQSVAPVPVLHHL